MDVKNQYYYFVTGLPNLSFDSHKQPFTTEEFRAMLDHALQPEDKELIHQYFLKYDNINLLTLLKNGNAELSNTGNFTSQQLIEALEEASTGTKISNKKIPPYISDFISLWLDEDTQNDEWEWEDLITSFYMDYGMDTNNSFVVQWFEFNMNIGNILSAIYSRKYNLPVIEAIVGNSEVAKTIRKNSNARDFGLGKLDIDYYEHLVRLADEPEIYERERKIDKLRWDWLTKNTEFDCFSIEYIFAWLCKLQILERWNNLNAEKGERVFRQLISDIKSEVEIPVE